MTLLAYSTECFDEAEDFAPVPNLDWIARDPALAMARLFVDPRDLGLADALLAA